MAGVKHRFIRTNGINMHIAEQGSGPVVLLLHGFVSIWSRWRHQMAALAGAGYHVVVPDQRGYGQTDAPAAEDQYTILHLVGDIVGLLDALGHKQVLLVGQDWGSIVGSFLCLFRPDRVKGYIAVSAPVLPRGPSEIDWLQQWTSLLGEGFYMARFQSMETLERVELGHQFGGSEPGRAERDFASVGTSATLKALVCVCSDLRKGRRTIAPNGKEISSLFLDEELPSWQPAEEHNYNVEMFEKSGFTGPLNWYRNFGRSYRLLAPWVNCPISTKTYYISGEYCVVNKFPGMAELIHGPAFKEFVPNLKATVIMKDAAHFVQEEKAEEFNEKLLTFLAELQKDD